MRDLVDPHGSSESEPVLGFEGQSFDASFPVVIIGAGACGCTAALAAKGRGAQVIILEQDARPAGNTALSGGQIPAAGTKLQKASGIEDSPDLLAKDLIAKAKAQCDIDLAFTIADEARRTIDWLANDHDMPLSCISNFVYPGHSRPHMHASPSRFGAELLTAFLAQVAKSEIDMATSARVTNLFAEGDGTIRGVRVRRPDGGIEDIGCAALILACNGYGGNKDLLRQVIPDFADAPYMGHEGNRGDAVIWGKALGASIKDLGAFQGHGAVCIPHMIQLGWPVFTEGGFQVNASGMRFSNENAGYSEQARKVFSQPGGVAWAVWDERCNRIAAQMHSHVLATGVGAIKTFASPTELARFIGCDVDAVATTIDDVAKMTSGEKICPWDRDFTKAPALKPPFYSAKITGALFHTQGGLEVNASGQVLRQDGTPFPNLFAGGGAARGLSGPSDWGYLSGSGLLMAVNLGRLAGQAAAELVTAG